MPTVNLLRALLFPALAFGLSGAAFGQRAPSSQAVNDAIDRGVEALRESVARPIERFHGGSSALYLYALVKGGADREDPAVVGLVSGLGFANLTGSYDRACAILALDALDRRAYADWIEELAMGLIDDQNEFGGWGYPHGEDLSNIQYAVLGLWAAERSGTQVPSETWERLAKRLAHYRSGGGFGYRNGSKATGSMTTAGLGVAAILLAQPEINGSRGKVQSKIELYQTKSLAWLDRNFSVEANPKVGGSWHYYYLYGLERAGALTGAKHIGDHDWYAEGAEVLLRLQKPDGHWGGSSTQTAFAILFLTRATGPVTGVKRAKGRHSPVTTDAESPMTFVAAGDTPLRMWIADWNDERIARTVWPGDEGQGPRVVKVEYLAGPTVLASVSGSSAAPAGATRFAAQHVFREPGSYEVRARAHVLLPRIDGKGGVHPGRTVLVESKPVAVSIDDAVPKWLRDQKAERQRVVRDRTPRVSASSHSPGGGDLPLRSFLPSFAVDGRMRTPWLADRDDPQPKLTLRFSSRVKVAGIRLYGARSTPHRMAAFRRPLEALVSIDGGKPQRVRMHVDERRAGVLDFPAVTRLRSIEITLPASAPAEEYDATGLAEVQLIAPKGKGR